MIRSEFQSHASFKKKFNQEGELNPEEKEEFVKGILSIIENHIEKTDFLTNYHSFFLILLTHCILNRPMYLCDIPEMYLRMIISYNFSLQETIGEFRNALQIIKSSNDFLNENSMQSLVFRSLIENSRFFYIRSLINEILKENPKAKFSLILRMDRFFSFQKYYEVSDLEHTWEAAFDVPKRPPIEKGETDEELIEKHALLDVMLQTNLWGREYVKNPFPYISEDFETLNESDVKDLKKKFYVNFQKYEKIKQEFLKI